MISATRDVFVAVLLAEETGNITHVKPEYLTLQAFAGLKTRIEAHQAAAETYEYRNLCIRKVDIVFVRPVAARSEQEFMARVTAHAQISIMRGSTVIRHDEAETLFVQYLDFHLENGQWKLSEILPQAQAAKIMASEQTV